MYACASQDRRKRVFWACVPLVDTIKKQKDEQMSAGHSLTGTPLAHYFAGRATDGTLPNGKYSKYDKAGPLAEERQAPMGLVPEGGWGDERRDMPRDDVTHERAGAGGSKDRKQGVAERTKDEQS